MTYMRWLYSRCYSAVFAATASMLFAGCNGDTTSTGEMGMDVILPATSNDFVERRLPNPVVEVILNWAPLPDGREWGSTAGIDIGPDSHIWAYDRRGPCNSICTAARP